LRDFSGEERPIFWGKADVCLRRMAGLSEFSGWITKSGYWRTGASAKSCASEKALAWRRLRAGIRFERRV